MVWSTLYDVETDTKDSAIPKQLVAGSAHGYLDHTCELNIRSPPALVRLTGIVCTIGPSSQDPVILERMMEAGMNIARLNCSHGTQAFHAQSIQYLRLAAENYSRKLGVKFPLCIALDIKGPEIRIGYVEGGATAEVELKKGNQIKLTTDKAYFEKGSASVMYIDYDNIQNVVEIGNRVYISDGLISLICTNIQGSVLTCVVEIGGMLGSCKGVNLPGVEVDLPAVSEKDKEDLTFGLEQGVDIVFASYIREPAAIDEIRNILGPKGRKIMVVAKIENHQGMEKIDEIMKVSDGIMVGRGDLGIELPVEKLFIAQKCIIAKCNLVGIPVICANQLLESMTNKSRPTRAECTDVANAVLDGTDCVMLTSETARGDYPVDTILIMARISKEAESAIWHRQHFNELVERIQQPIDLSHAVSLAAVEAATKCSAAAIIVVTETGKSAFLLSKYRPKCPTIAIMRDEKRARQMHLYRGVLPLVYMGGIHPNHKKDLELRINFGINFGKWRGFIKDGDPVVAISGSRKSAGSTDSLSILYVTKPVTAAEPCGI